jgi:hypothetical protein
LDVTPPLLKTTQSWKTCAEFCRLFHQLNLKYPYNFSHLTGHAVKPADKISSGNFLQGLCMAEVMFCLSVLTLTGRISLRLSANESQFTVTNLLQKWLRHLLFQTVLISIQEEKFDCIQIIQTPRATHTLIDES